MKINNRRRVFHALIMLFLSVVPGLPAVSDEAAVYFNAGTEKYLRGRFSDAVDDLEKAQKLEPGNVQIREFMTRILLEAATQDHLNHNYPLALQRLEKARGLSPDNAKVREMYELTNTLLGKPAEKSVFRKSLFDDTASGNAKIAAAASRNEKKPEARPPSNAERKPSLPATAAAGMKTGPAQSFSSLKGMDRKTVAAGAGVFLALLFMVSWGVQSSKLRRLSARHGETEEKLRLCAEEKNALVIEIEKMKERVKYEHQAAEQLRKDMKEQSRREEERLKAELELRTKQAEERVRGELLSRRTGTPAPEEAFLHQQQARFIEYVDSSCVIDETLSPALEAARDRISVMAENLYEYAPGAATDFLNKMAANENALIRSNVVRALARIARPETIETLFRLFADADYRVRRETLKNLKQLRQRIVANEIVVPEELQVRITTLLDAEKRRGEWIL